MITDKTISLDFCGTITSCAFLDKFWMDIIPRRYSEQKGLDFNEAKVQLMKMYDTVGDADIRWYLPNYWISLLKLNRERIYDDIKGLVNIRTDIKEVIRELKRYNRMIISTNVAHEIIDQIKYDLGFDKIYSCISDYGIIHKDENFWTAVLRDEGVDAFNVFHFGDDEIYDFLIPTSLGIRCELVNSFNLRKTLMLRLLSNA